MFCIKIVYFCKSAGGQANWHHLPASEYEIFVAKNQAGIFIPPDFYLFQKMQQLDTCKNMFASQFYIFGTKKCIKSQKKFKKYAKNYIIFKNFQKKQNRVLKKRKFCDIMYLQKRLCCCITIYGGIIWIQKLQV